MSLTLFLCDYNTIAGRIHGHYTCCQSDEYIVIDPTIVWK